METPIPTRDATIPDEIVEKWQTVVDIAAEILGVPSALIMRIDPPYIEVFRSSDSEGNPYQRGDREHLAGLYCEEVMRTGEPLSIPNALKDERWKDNPDIKLGMIAYVGLPILWPAGETFGTICVLDMQENELGEVYMRLLGQLKELVESHLALTDQNRELAKNLAEIRTLRGIVPICAWCKKVRDDTGYWQAVEVYVRDHTEADFSHGMCPECAGKTLEET